MADVKDVEALKGLQMDKTGISEYFTPRYGEPLSFGYTADVYRDGDRVLKVYSPTFDKCTIFREAYAGACVESVGVRCPKVYGVRNEGGFFVLDTELVQGKDMLSMMMGFILGGDLEGAKELIRRMARLHAAANQSCCPGLPSYRAYAEMVIRGSKKLSDGQKERTLTYLAGLPDGDCVCHGDFHPQNVLVAPDGTMTVIDWAESGRACSACDPARTWMNLTCLPPIPPLQVPGLDLNETYLTAYLEASPELTREDVMAWLPVHAAINYGNKEPWYCKMIEPWLL